MEVFHSMNLLLIWNLVKKKTDSKSHIIESFKSIAGDKEYITSGDLFSTLPKEKVEYLLTQMPKYKDIPDGYDYVKWANETFGN